MITAYCSYLSNDAPETSRSEANVNAFEQKVYNFVFN